MGEKKKGIVSLLTELLGVYTCELVYCPTFTQCFTAVGVERLLLNKLASRQKIDPLRKQLSDAKDRVAKVPISLQCINLTPLNC